MENQKHDLKVDWIMRHKADPELDYDVVFKDDDEIHDNIKMQFTFLTQQNAMNQTNPNRRQTKEWRAIHASIPDEEWEYRFNQLMDLNLIDVPDNYYDDRLFFSNPDEIKQFFDKLEEDNLSKIHQAQEQAEL